jgi:hypothetical protein
MPDDPPASPAGRRLRAWWLWVGGLATAVVATVVGGLIQGWLMPEARPPAGPSGTTRPAVESSAQASGIPTATWTTQATDTRTAAVAGETYQTGTATLGVGGFGHESINLDINDAYYNRAGDVVATADGFGGNDGTVFGPWPATKRPTLGDCEGLSPDVWSPTVPKTELKPGAIFCVTTSEQRRGYLVVQRVDVSRQGDVTSVALNFVLWKKPTDE